MFGIGSTEFLLIAIVALIVVGPKDLPGMFRAIGRFTGKARRMANEFSRAMEDAANEAGVKDAADALKAAGNPKKFGLDKLNDAADKFDKWDPLKNKSGDSPLSEDRASAAKKISENAARMAEERKAREAAELSDEPELPATPAKPARKTTTAKSARKPAAAKAAAAAPAAAKTTAAKPKSSAKATAAPAAKATAQKTAAKKPAVKAAPKTAASKPRKAPARKVAEK